MKPFNWTCPYCNHAVTVTDHAYSYSLHKFAGGNKTGGWLGLATSVIVCQNPKCGEYSIDAVLWPGEFSPSFTRSGANIQEWRLRPSSKAKVFPGYIPLPLLKDYEEACLIRDLSPKASATLSRRCLQGMIRDFWRVSEANLFLEINAIKDKVDPVTWSAIDAVRSIGNIGAHMEKDINLVVEVEPAEAQLLIGLIEMLLKDWYVVRFERQKQLEDIVTAAKQKQKLRKSGD
ncbi:TPA: DUF4145 domain-containing protein [Pseudomonas aeruginosa]